MDRTKVIGIGLGVPGPIDVGTGVLGSTAILPGWAGTNPREELAARTGVPVHVDNDANLGALGEQVWGSGRGVEDLAYIKVASGVGAGLVINGQIYRGPGGTAGEIGHITLDESGPVCRCGNRGCLETFTAARYVLPLLHSSHGTGLTMARVVRLAREGDPGCRRVIADIGRHIGSGVAKLCNLLNPSRVVLGGDLAEAGELVLGPDPGLRGALRDPQCGPPADGASRRAGRPCRGVGRARAGAQRDGRGTLLDDPAPSDVQPRHACLHLE